MFKTKPFFTLFISVHILFLLAQTSVQAQAQKMMSNLPIIEIVTDGSYIQDDPKITAKFKLWYKPSSLNDFTKAPDKTYTIAIELRGSSSQSFPKKSYGLEFRQTANTNLDTTLGIFGFPSESDFVLIANYSDKTLMRSALLYTLSNKIGRYAPRTQFCELYLNGEYMGVYLFAEKIKRDSFRVNVSKLEPDETTGKEVTGGYILKIDKNTGGADGWISPHPPLNNIGGQSLFIQYHYPSYEDINESQENYIRTYVTRFENALAYLPLDDTAIGYRAYLDIPSAVDFFILNEISKNIDSYRLSTFFYKHAESKGGKLHFGPIWDFDLALKNADYYDGDKYYGWVYEFPYDWDWFQPPFWWPKMLSDAYFQQTLKCRWNHLRQNELSTQNILSAVDSIFDDLNTAQTRNFIRWPILNEYVWPNPQVMGTYQAEVEVLRNFISDRLMWLDMNMPGRCATSVVAELSNFQFFINKNQQIIEFQFLQAEPINIELIDMSGRVLCKKVVNENTAEISIEGLSSMVYVLRLSSKSGSATRKIVL